jgi:hypothetical protein
MAAPLGRGRRGESAGDIIHTVADEWHYRRRPSTLNEDHVRVVTPGRNNGVQCCRAKRAVEMVSARRDFDTRLAGKVESEADESHVHQEVLFHPELVVRASSGT